jgi:hypothetical protein
MLIRELVKQVSKVSKNVSGEEEKDLYTLSKILKRYSNDVYYFAPLASVLQGLQAQSLNNAANLFAQKQIQELQRPALKNEVSTKQIRLPSLLSQGAFPRLASQSISVKPRSLKVIPRQISKSFLAPIQPQLVPQEIPLMKHQSTKLTPKPISQKLSMPRLPQIKIPSKNVVPKNQLEGVLAQRRRRYGVVQQTPTNKPVKLQPQVVPGRVKQLINRFQKNVL